MALKSSLLWFKRNWRKTSSRFFTSRGPRTIRADFCRDTKASASAPERRLVLPARCSPPSGTQTLWGQPGALLTPAALKGTPATPSCSGSPSCGTRAKFNLSWVGNAAEARY